jgi:hypothetical protein
MSYVMAKRSPVVQHASGTRELSDAEFVAAFESCALAADAFRHYDHIRLAWAYLEAHPLDEATERMAESIRRFARHHTGSTAKYDENLTRAWMRLVAHARSASDHAPDFATFAEAHPMLFDRRRAFDAYDVAGP